MTFFYILNCLMVVDLAELGSAFPVTSIKLPCQPTKQGASDQHPEKAISHWPAYHVTPEKSLFCWIFHIQMIHFPNTCSRVQVR